MTSFTPRPDTFTLNINLRFQVGHFRLAPRRHDAHHELLRRPRHSDAPRGRPRRRGPVHHRAQEANVPGGVRRRHLVRLHGGKAGHVDHRRVPRVVRRRRGHGGVRRERPWAALLWPRHVRADDYGAPEEDPAEQGGDRDQSGWYAGRDRGGWQNETSGTRERPSERKRENERTDYDPLFQCWNIVLCYRTYSWATTTTTPKPKNTPSIRRYSIV